METICYHCGDVPLHSQSPIYIAASGMGTACNRQTLVWSFLLSTWEHRVCLSLNVKHVLPHVKHLHEDSEESCQFTSGFLPSVEASRLRVFSADCSVAAGCCWTAENQEEAKAGTSITKRIKSPVISSLVFNIFWKHIWSKAYCFALVHFLDVKVWIGFEAFLF